MNVGELKKCLNEWADDLPILMSVDEEGNRFARLTVFSPQLWNASNIDPDIRPMHEDIGSYGYTEEDRAPEDYVPVVVFWP